MWNFATRFLFNFDIFVQNKISMSFITIFIFLFSRLESIPDSWKFIWVFFFWIFIIVFWISKILMLEIF